VFDRRNICCVEVEIPDATPNPQSFGTERTSTLPALPALGISWAY
jgi:hypothetical protein